MVSSEQERVQISMFICGLCSGCFCGLLTSISSAVFEDICMHAREASLALNKQLMSISVLGK